MHLVLLLLLVHIGHRGDERVRVDHRQRGLVDGPVRCGRARADARVADGPVVGLRRHAQLPIA